MTAWGAFFYRGPSLLTGDPILGLISGLDGTSLNAKTGPMAQVWILRADRPPTDAIRDGSDDAVCGDCALRGQGATGRACYVTPWLGPLNVWKQRDAYVDVSGDPDDLRAVAEGQSLRLGAYGDPAAIPFNRWATMLETAAGWVGYTHQWRSCDQRFARIVMASVDSFGEQVEAASSGWRTFRVRRHRESLVYGPLVNGRVTPIEFICPASAEAGQRTTCHRCQLCRGTSSPARHVAIYPHGKPGNLKVYGLRSENTGRPTGHPLQNGKAPHA